MNRITDYVDFLVKTRVPYLDVIAFKDGEELFRYYNARKGATGKERLLMFSATKPLTAVLTLRLVEEGVLSLDTTVSELLPEYKDVYLLNEKGERIPPQTVMTVKHLLTMTAGLTYDLSRYPVEQALHEKGSMTDTRAAASAFAKAPLVFNPGARFQYSLCHDVLAAVIEVASGMPFSAYMERIILDPLGMKNTCFSKRSDNDVADLYTADAEGNVYLSAKENTILVSDHYESGGAGLISTIEDYARFARALSIGGAGILQAESLKRLYTPTLDTIAVDNSFTCVQGSDYGYGLGVRVRRVPTAWGLSVGEYGWDGAAGTYLMVDPVKRVSVVIGLHLMNWPAVFRHEHLAIVQKIYEAFSI